MIVTSHQPNFLPYLGVIYKAYRSNIFVLSDDVQYSKKGMHNYNFIRSKDGQQKLTVPVSAHHDAKLCEIMVADPQKNLRKVSKTLRETYARTEHFDEGMEVVGIIEKYAGMEAVSLSEMNGTLIRYIMGRMRIKTHILTATKDLSLIGHKDDRILMMCQQTAAKTYYSGVGAKVYHDDEQYRGAGVDLVYSDYEPVIYCQKFEPFIENLSCIDYVFNEGYKLPEVWV